MNRIEKLVKAWTARENCKKNGNDKWFEYWDQKVESINPPLQNCTIDFVSDRIVAINSSSYVTDENGYHLGYIEWRIFLRPSFVGGLTVDPEVLSSPESLGCFDLECYAEDIGDTLYHYFSEEVPKDS